MKELNNDHIVKLYESFEDKEFLYMVLEYCDGGRNSQFSVLKKTKRILLLNKR